MQLHHQLKITFYQALVLLMVIIASGVSLGVEGEAKILTHADPLELQVTHEIAMGKNAYRRLINDIKQNGIQEPIKYVEHEGKFYVVDGHHRLAAARQLNLSEVPVEKTTLPYAGYKTSEDLNYYGY